MIEREDDPMDDDVIDAKDAVAGDDVFDPAPEAVAQRFHEAYERLAPQFSYETRKASAKPWAEVPENNRALMTAVVRELLGPEGCLDVRP